MAPCMLTSELAVHMLKYCKEGTFVVLSSTTLLLLLLLFLLHGFSELLNHLIAVINKKYD